MDALKIHQREIFATCQKSAKRGDGQRQFFLISLNSYWAGFVILRNKNLTLFKIIYF